MNQMSSYIPDRQYGAINPNIFGVAALFLIAVMGLAWVYTGMIAKDRWPIRWLEVDGVFQRVHPEQLRGSLTSMMGTSFFTVDMNGIRDTALNLPWVASASVQKEWPDTVRVRVEEYIPVAHWLEGQLISNRGEVFAVPGADEIQGLPWLEGPAERLQQMIEAWQTYRNELHSVGLEIQRLTLDRRGAWSMVLNNGTVVQIGRESALARLQRLISGWPSLIRQREVPPLQVDLRYTNGFAVRWDQTLNALGNSDA